MNLGLACSREAAMGSTSTSLLLISCSNTCGDGMCQGMKWMVAACGGYMWPREAVAC